MVKKGYSEDTAIQKVKESQVKNGIEWYTEKYGETEGAELYDDRMHRYKNSYALEVEADPSINHRKTVAICRASKESLELFLPVIEDLSLTDYYIGYEGKKEYFLRNNTEIYFYDFAIPSLKLIFEYNGSRFHPNKDALTEEGWRSWRGLYTNSTADAVHDKDQKKKLLAESRGFSVHYIWDTDDTALAIERIKTLILEARNATS